MALVKYGTLNAKSVGVVAMEAVVLIETVVVEGVVGEAVEEDLIAPHCSRSVAVLHKGSL
jgi:hypothetical protein